jgi:predicted outer membrane repeat protein
MPTRMQVLLAIICLGLPAPSYCITIRVPAEQPTIQAGINAASSGDSVLVAPGIYAGFGNKDLYLAGKSIALVSESGAQGTVIDCENQGRGLVIESPLTDATVINGFTIRNGLVPNQGGAINFQFASPRVGNCVFSDNVAGGGGAFYCHSSSPTIEDCVFTRNAGNGGAIASVVESSPTIRACLFRENTGGQGGAIYAGARARPAFAECTFDRNEATSSGGAVYSQSNAEPSLANCTIVGSRGIGAGVSVKAFLGNPGAAVLLNTVIAFSVQGEAIHCDAASTAELRCCDLFANAGGDWVGCIEGQLGVDGNISMDPLFCDAANGDFTLHEGSPCAPGHSPPGCGLIGAEPVGCGVTTVESATWGRIKAQYEAPMPPKDMSKHPINRK